MTAEKAVLEIQHLQKNFGHFQALKGVDLTLHRGEVLGFIGPNGAGKSTTIRIILGLIQPTSGLVRVFGQDAWKQATTIHRQLAYVPGDVTLWPNLTGGQTIDFLLKLAGQAHNRRTDELIANFALDPLKKNRTYSKGNRQKVALIAALATDVPFYIFDEPTSGLDPLNERLFQEEVAGLKGAGKTVLLSSHILSEVEKMGDTIAIIREGAIIEQGDLKRMQHLTRSQIQVTASQSLAALAHFSGVHQLHFANPEQTEASFSLDPQALSTVLAYLAQQSIQQLKTTQPTLEDLFLQYYDAAKTQDGGEK